MHNTKYKLIYFLSSHHSTAVFKTWRWCQHQCTQWWQSGLIRQNNDSSQGKDISVEFVSNFASGYSIDDESHEWSGLKVYQINPWVYEVLWTNFNIITEAIIQRSLIDLRMRYELKHVVLQRSFYVCTNGLKNLLLYIELLRFILWSTQLYIYKYFFYHLYY